MANIKLYDILNYIKNSKGIKGFLFFWGILTIICFSIYALVVGVDLLMEGIKTLIPKNEIKEDAKELNEVLINSLSAIYPGTNDSTIFVSGLFYEATAQEKNKRIIFFDVESNKRIKSLNLDKNISDSYSTISSISLYNGKNYYIVDSYGAYSIYETDDATISITEITDSILPLSSHIIFADFGVQKDKVMLTVLSNRGEELYYDFVSKETRVIKDSIPNSSALIPSPRTRYLSTLQKKHAISNTDNLIYQDKEYTVRIVKEETTSYVEIKNKANKVEAKIATSRLKDLDNINAVVRKDKLLLISFSTITYKLDMEEKTIKQYVIPVDADTNR